MDGHTSTIAVISQQEIAPIAILSRGVIDPVCDLSQCLSLQLEPTVGVVLGYGLPVLLSQLLIKHFAMFLSKRGRYGDRIIVI